MLARKSLPSLLRLGGRSFSRVALPSASSFCALRSRTLSSRTNAVATQRANVSEPNAKRALRHTSSFRRYTTLPGGVRDTQIRTGPTEPTPLTETLRDFLEPKEFYELLGQHGMDFYTGVPDSLLKDFCAYVSDTCPPHKHIITANEGAAVAVGAGYHMATGRYPVVYMQNSGFGNATNPLLSLCDRHVYSVPMLLLIGWRGEPGKKDEPQHLVQGRLMGGLLADMHIHFEVLPDYIEGAGDAVRTAVHHMQTRQCPYAFLVKRQCFTPYKLKNKEANNYKVNREEAIKLMIDHIGQFDVVVATTGFASRELYELREQKGQQHHQEFLTVGSMGHASAIGVGIAIAKPSRQVFVLDGDGAAIMHMGTMSTVGWTKVRNYKHIMLNNGSHDSVGGQPTNGFNVDFCNIARACGYKEAFSVTTPEEITQGIARLRSLDGPAFMEIRINKGARTNLGRPKGSPKDNKTEFMQFLQG